MKNPHLVNVNTEDPEDCEACGDGEWPCAFHAGWIEGARYLGRALHLAIEDPERIRVRPEEMVNAGQ